MMNFDPHKFIDRDIEQELFEDLLQLKDAARILAVRDAGGMGKSQLLERFQYRCRTVRPRTPVSLVTLDQLPDASPLALIKIMAQQLACMGVAFPQLTKCEQSQTELDTLSTRRRGDFKALYFGPTHIFKSNDYTLASQKQRSVGATISTVDATSTHRQLRQILVLHFSDNDLRNLCFDMTIDYDTLPGESKDGKARELILHCQRNARLDELAGIAVQLRPYASWQAMHPDLSDNTPEAEPQLDLTTPEAYLNAFFNDLKQVCADRPVVLMLDAYEKCASELKEWIEQILLEWHFFNLNHRPAQLILVVAGREVPTFEYQWPEEDCDAIVRTIGELGKWERRHVEECLRVHGFDYEQHHLDTFHRLVEMGIPPSQVVQAIQSAVAVRRRQP